MTSFDEIFEIYLNRITTYKLLNLTDKEKYDDLILKLKMAMARFDDINLVEVDYVNKLFSRELSPIEIDILSFLMICEWLKPMVLSEEALSNKLTSKDYNVYSPANLLAQLRSVKKDADNEVGRLINKYGYSKKYLKKQVE